MFLLFLHEWFLSFLLRSETTTQTRQGITRKYVLRYSLVHVKSSEKKSQKIFLTKMFVTFSLFKQHPSMNMIVTQRALSKMTTSLALILKQWNLLVVYLSKDFYLYTSRNVFQDKTIFWKLDKKLTMLEAKKGRVSSLFLTEYVEICYN